MLTPYGYLAPSLFSVHCVRIQYPAEKQGLHSCVCLLESRQSLSPHPPCPFCLSQQWGWGFQDSCFVDHPSIWVWLFPPDSIQVMYFWQEAGYLIWCESTLQGCGVLAVVRVFDHQLKHHSPNHLLAPGPQELFFLWVHSVEWCH